MLNKGVLSVLIISIFLISLVSAAELPTANEMSQSITSAINYLTQGVLSPIFTALLGSVESIGEDSRGEILFIKAIAFLITALVVFATFDSMNIFGSKRSINAWLGILVALIGIRFLPNDFLVSMAIPSSAFIATIVLLAPLIVIAFVGSKIRSAIARKVLYVSYAVVIIMLWFYNYNNDKLTGWGLAVYPAIAAVCIILFILDGTFNRLLTRAKESAKVEYTSTAARDAIIGEIRNLESGLASASSVADINRINAEIKIKQEALKALS